MFTGLGLMVGPALGGVLYQVWLKVQSILFLLKKKAEENWYFENIRNYLFAMTQNIIPLRSSLQYGGFGTPFWTTGGMLLAVAVASIFMLPPKKCEYKPNNVRKLRYFKAQLSCIIYNASSETYSLKVKLSVIYYLTLRACSHGRRQGASSGNKLIYNL